MLSAVVIHKGDDYLPGPGFFALGRELSRETSDKLSFHSAELTRVQTPSHASRATQAETTSSRLGVRRDFESGASSWKP